MNLYKIETEILECIDEETGEIFDEERFAKLQLSREEKIENTVLWIKNLKSDNAALKSEEEALAKRRKSNENLLKSLQNYLSDALHGEKFNTAKAAVSFRKSKSVEVFDVYKVAEFNDGLVKYGEPKPDKVAIKKLIDSGLSVPGCALAEKLNIQIK